MSKTVKIGDSIVGKVGVGSRRLTCGLRKHLILYHVAWRHAANVVLKSRPIRPSVRRDQGRSRCHASWCETLPQQWSASRVFAVFRNRRSPTLQASSTGMVSQKQT